MYSNLENSEVLKFRKQMECDGVSQLVGILNEHKCVIAGSYVLQSLCDASWANDIDIWGHNIDTEKMFKDLENLRYVRTMSYNSNAQDNAIQKKVIKINEKLKNKNNLLLESDIFILQKLKKYYETEYRVHDIIQEIYDNYRRLRESIICIHFFKHSSRPPIQIIETKKSIIDCIDQFDLNICRVYFDGENVVAKNKDYLLDCIKHKFAEITKEASEIQSSYEWIRTLRRALKYTERGFFIDFRNGYANIMKNAKKDFIVQWNKVLCEEKSFYTGESNIFEIDYPTTANMKTVKLPYFHSYYEKEREIIFGYMINPNNTLGKLAKKIAQHTIFRTKYKGIPSKLKCINTIEHFNIDYNILREKNLPYDVVEEVGEMFKPVSYDMKKFIKSRDYNNFLTCFKTFLSYLEDGIESQSLQHDLNKKIKLPIDINPISDMKEFIRNVNNNHENFSRVSKQEKASILYKLIQHIQALIKVLKKVEHKDLNNILKKYQKMLNTLEGGEEKENSIDFTPLFNRYENIRNQFVNFVLEVLTNNPPSKNMPRSFINYSSVSYLERVNNVINVIRNEKIRNVISALISAIDRRDPAQLNQYSIIYYDILDEAYDSEEDEDTNYPLFPRHLSQMIRDEIPQQRSTRRREGAHLDVQSDDTYGMDESKGSEQMAPIIIHDEDVERDVSENLPRIRQIFSLIHNTPNWSLEDFSEFFDTRLDIETINLEMTNDEIVRILQPIINGFEDEPEEDESEEDESD